MKPVHALSSAALSVVTLMSCTTVAPAGSTTQFRQLPIPVIARVDRWDDHWFWWLPHHPVYESIEVAARDPGANGHRDLWVWLTERAGAKRQVHYRNNPELLAAPPSSYREFEFTVSGDPGGPRSMTLAFTDPDGVPISLSMDVRRSLRRTAGLTGQGGHAASQVFLLFYRQQETLAASGVAQIGGRNFAFTPTEPNNRHPFRWHYSRGIFVGAVPFVTLDGHFGPGGYISMEASNGALSRILPDRSTVTLTPARDGGLMEYSYKSPNGASLAFHFSPSLPICRDRMNVERSTFRASLADLPEAVRGEVETRCEASRAVYHWRPTSPAWASRQPFVATFVPGPGGTFRLSVGPDMRAPPGEPRD